VLKAAPHAKRTTMMKSVLSVALVSWLVLRPANFASNWVSLLEDVVRSAANRALRRCVSVASRQRVKKHRESLAGDHCNTCMEICWGITVRIVFLGPGTCARSISRSFIRQAPAARDETMQERLPTPDRRFFHTTTFSRAWATIHSALSSNL